MKGTSDYTVFKCNTRLPAKTLPTSLACTDFSIDGFITSPSLTLTSFELKDVTLNYAWFLNIGILALGPERTIYIVIFQVKMAYVVFAVLLTCCL